MNNATSLTMRQKVERIFGNKKEVPRKKAKMDQERHVVVVEHDAQQEEFQSVQKSSNKICGNEHCKKSIMS